jgi:tripartite-type tricarboxylate transporter receptor subunit TctC
MRRNVKDEKTTPELKLLFIVVAALFILFSTNLTFSAESNYPSKPIKLICAYGPGGSTDIAARTLASNIQPILGQPVVVVNMPGGGGAVGFDEVRKSDPDGYKMLMASIGGNSILFAMDTTFPFKYDELSFIARTQINPGALIVKANSPWKDFKEFAEALKKNPGKYKFSTSSVGGIQYLGAVMILMELGLDASAATPVHFDSDPEAILAVARGDVDFFQGNYISMIPNLKGGQVRCLAVTTPKRLEALSEVPTYTELGHPNINIVGWRGVCGPPGLPQSILTKWEEAIQKTCSSKQWLDLVTKLGDEPGYMNSTDFKKFVDSEFLYYRDIFTKLNLLKK